MKSHIQRKGLPFFHTYKKIIQYLHIRYEILLLRKSTFFDSNWYMSQYKDVQDSNIDPAQHYILYGWHELRDPGPNFSTHQYLILNPDVRLSEVNPLLHYEKFGMKEKRRTKDFSQYMNLISRPIKCSLDMDVPDHYCLTDRPSAYTYIPLQKPRNFNSIVEKTKYNIKFSILVPVYNTPEDFLRKTIESVQSQWHRDWELILVDDASTSEKTKEVLRNINNPQIFCYFLPNNHGIAGTTNVAGSYATGDFIVLLDHDDELTNNCLYELALCIDRENPDYIYSDEDKIDSEGFFTEPHFKPDWSPDTMMSTMYVCHVSCIRRSLWDELGGLMADCDGCQDWDLVLRIAEKTKKISHICKVLYHWRIIPGSIASNISAKSCVLQASKKVREDALTRRGQKGIIEPLDRVQGYFRVNYILQNNPLISIIIPTKDNLVILKKCMVSIFSNTSYDNYELLLVDNGSTSKEMLDYFDYIKITSNVSVIRHDAPFNFSQLNNLGIRNSHGEILLFLNDDTEVITRDWLERMGGYAQLPHVGAVGAKLVYPDRKSIQHAGILNLQDGPGHAFLKQDANIHGYYLRNLLEYNWVAVTGACLMIERKKIQAAGMFDETFPIAYNDVELCFRLIEKGLYNVVCQSVEQVHHESMSRGIDDLDSAKRERLERDKKHLYDVHPFFYQYDPFYNVNLHPNGINFEIPR